MPFTAPSKSSKDYMKASGELHDKLKSELKAGGIKTPNQIRVAAKAGAAKRLVPTNSTPGQKNIIRGIGRAQKAAKRERAAQ